jgi:hypothetical protein
MVNYNDPSVQLLDACAYGFAVNLGCLGSQLTPFDSGSSKILACHRRSLFVRLLHRWASAPIRYLIITNRCFIFSWDYVTTLDYEWSVIQRRRPYRWTIWVRTSDVLSVGFTEHWTDLSPLVDLLHYAHIYSRGCYTLLIWS